MRTSTYTLTDIICGGAPTTITSSDDDIPALIRQAMHASGEMPADVEQEISDLADAIGRGGTIEATTRDIAIGLGLTIAAV